MRPTVRFKQAAALMDIDGTFFCYCSGVRQQAGVIVGPYVRLGKGGCFGGY